MASQIIDPTVNGVIIYDVGDRFTYRANTCPMLMPTVGEPTLIPVEQQASFRLTEQGWIPWKDTP